MKNKALESIVKGYFRKYKNAEVLHATTDGTVYFEYQKKSAEDHAKFLGTKIETFERKVVFAEEIKAEKARIEAERKADEKRLADEKAEKEAKEKAEKQRLADEAKAEKQRLADEKKAAEAAEKAKTEDETSKK